MLVRGILLVLCIISLTCSYTIRSPSILRQSRQELFLANSNSESSPFERIRSLIQQDRVVLFMKGEKDNPKCGFSEKACRTLKSTGTPFTVVNVLLDPLVRSEIKEYSNWPTIPQLYVDGEFVGGSDIMIEMYNSGELAKIIESEDGGEQ